MIFVTVGTHEQPFNRLVAFMDKWAEVHDEKVIIQTGFSTYNPINCVWDKFYPYKKIKLATSITAFCKSAITKNRCCTLF